MKRTTMALASLLILLPPMSSSAFESVKRPIQAEMGLYLKLPI